MKRTMGVLGALLFLCGCAAIPSNQPVASYPALTWDLQKKALAKPIGVWTVFQDGSNAMHDRRADNISRALIEQITRTTGEPQRNKFEVIESWNTPRRGKYAFIIQLYCDTPFHEKRKNKPLMLLGWPATISIIAAPLGVAVLSWRGIVHEHVTFDWRASIVSGDDVDTVLKAQKIPRIEADVCATGWGTPQETIVLACKSADTHVVSSALAFLSKNDLNNVLTEMAATPPRAVEPDSPPDGIQVNVRWKRGDTHVLAVGVGGFSDAAIPQLEFSEFDAEKMAHFFHAAGVATNNISVLAGEKATRNDILARLSEIRQKMDEQALGILYFSGHGAPIISYDKQTGKGEVKDAVLVPFDARETALSDTGITLSFLRSKLSETEHDWLVILDACFSGKSGRSIMPEGVKGMTVMPTSFANSSEERVCWLLATSGSNYANENAAQKSGLFTHYLLEALNNAAGSDADGNGELSIKEVFSWTAEKVKKWSRSQGKYQEPELDAPQDKVAIPLLQCGQP